jgi:hypothetical protein
LVRISKNADAQSISKQGPKAKESATFKAYARPKPK